MGQRKQTLDERFARHTTPEPNTGCMLWIGHINPNGYGQMSVDAKTRPAHRVAFECAGGRMTAGMQLDHICQVRSCVNPAHLRAVTPRQNMSHLFGKNAGRYSSRFTGVSFIKKIRKWGASAAGRSAERIFLGVFKDERDAAMAYRMEALEIEDGGSWSSVVARPMPPPAPTRTCKRCYVELPMESFRAMRATCRECVGVEKKLRRRGPGGDALRASEREADKRRLQSNPATYRRKLDRHNQRMRDLRKRQAEG